MYQNNILICGVGGQGVLYTSNVLTSILLCCTMYDIKTSEIHGFSQRGGSVSVDIKIGNNIHSPTINFKEADYLLDLDGKEYKNYLAKLSKKCKIKKKSFQRNSVFDFKINEIETDLLIEEHKLNMKSSNMILLSCLLKELGFELSTIKTALNSISYIDTLTKEALLLMLKE